MKKRPLEIAIWIFVLIAGFFLLFALSDSRRLFENSEPSFIFGEQPLLKKRATPSGPIQPAKPISVPVQITQHSPEVFAYAHGTVIADGQIFIGMAARSGNPFPTNQVYVFSDLNDLKQFRIISIPRTGDIESMVYDGVNDEIYFTLSNNGSLEIYRIDPKTYYISTVISTTSLDIGLKPAITTDGKYIYGITYTSPATVFKVGINDASLVTDSIGHIRNGHSAAIGVYGSSTEVYFGGGEADVFEKVNADNLTSLGMSYFPGCSITDDMPFQKIDDGGGFVYLGCERMPFGYRVETEDMSTTRFDLPGNSFGLFIYGNDLYNAAQDGNYDIFKDMDITKLVRYYVGQDIQLNELFVSSSSTATPRLYFTGWWGVKGLFEVGSSTLSLGH